MRPNGNDRLRLNRRALIAGGIAILLVHPVSAEETVVGRIGAVRGNAVAEALAVRRPLTLDSEVFVGDTVLTFEQSRLRMTFGSAMTVQLGANNQFRIDRIEATAGTLFNLTAGALLIERQDGHRHSALELRTPAGVITTRGGKLFAGPSFGAFGVLVLRGEATVTSAGEAVLLRAGQATDLRKPGQVPSPPRRWSADRVGTALASVSGL
jgi:hypothetical protein